MNTNISLMVGDWAVLVNPDGHKCIPQKVTVDGLMLVIGKEEGIYQYEPVQLTEEMLELNGFDKKYYNDVCGQNYIFYPNTNIAFSKKADGSLETNILLERFVIRYVHELQQALRLCGLNDLANNFRLK